MKSNDSPIKVAMADDHILLRNALASLIDSYGGCKVIHESSNGKELIEKVQAGLTPDVVILDLSMPIMDGFETAKWFKVHRPEIQILMLTMYDSEHFLIRLLQVGVKGFLKKDINPDELKFAINSVMQSGYYYSNETTGRLANLFRNPNLQNGILTEPEHVFLKLICTDLTYKEIAQRMKLNPRTVDTLREQLFLKLEVKSRVGLAMMAIRHGIVSFL